LADALTRTDLALPGSGDAFGAYLTRPAVPRGPAILLLPEMFGLTPAMRASADAFADHGRAVLAPNLFWRALHPQTLDYDGLDRDRANDRIATLDTHTAIADIATAAAYLSNVAGTPKVVAIGHCIGGRLAVLALSRLHLAGAISYYGLGLSAFRDDLRAIQAPVQLHYGLNDPHVPLSDIDAVAALTEDNPHVKLYRYAGAGHSFVNPNRPMFDAGYAEMVMQRSLDLVEAIGM
jgi:carboxymethylenebutenolidase